MPRRRCSATHKSFVEAEQDLNYETERSKSGTAIAGSQPLRSSSSSVQGGLCIQEYTALSYFLAKPGASAGVRSFESLALGFGGEGSG